jgi:hypothetical protein
MSESAQSNDAEELVAIASFADEVSVHLAASKLESEGIRAVADDPQQPVGGLHTSVLRVLAEDVARAREILMETPARDQLI